MARGLKKADLADVAISCLFADATGAGQPDALFLWNATRDCKSKHPTSANIRNLTLIYV